MKLLIEEQKIKQQTKITVKADYFLKLSLIYLDHFQMIILKKSLIYRMLSIKFSLYTNLSHYE